MLFSLVLEHFHFENALLTRKRQPPQRGVHSGENRVFRLNATFDFHKKSKVICLEHFLIEHIHFQSKTALIAPLPPAGRWTRGHCLRRLLLCQAKGAPCRAAPCNHP
ncbi:hypothetical protein [Desulfovibrio sp. ZJ200]|uniref:hypothetical protein n=1 Tax=Desulfovibrio sp. ZJ200 TaxID=2709792 RepID=UPI0013EE2F76|nr:hypothetical protein [Desulfovibrio sp. ZJ200]